MSVSASSWRKKRGADPKRQMLQSHVVKRRSLIACGWLLVVTAHAAVSAKPSARTVNCYDFVEVTLQVSHPPVGNPFTEAEVVGELSGEGGSPLKVDGFCDSDDGSVFRIRFMPSQPGKYRYSVTYRRGGTEEKREGQFTARRGKRKGLVRLDREHPFHFVCVSLFWPVKL